MEDVQWSDSVAWKKLHNAANYSKPKLCNNCLTPLRFKHQCPNDTHTHTHTNVLNSQQQKGKCLGNGKGQKGKGVYEVEQGWSEEGDDWSLNTGDEEE